MDALRVSRNSRTGDTVYEGYDTSQICENGHAITQTAESWGKGYVRDYCPKCGSKTITQWGLLQYVMSDPKSDLVPAKKKLFEIGIAKALPATREFFLDLMVKLSAEMLKP